MKKLILSIVLFAITLSIIAHPGRLDARGGHTNRRTGSYHYHRSQPQPSPAVNTAHSYRASNIYSITLKDDTRLININIIRLITGSNHIYYKFVSETSGDQSILVTNIEKITFNGRDVTQYIIQGNHVK